MSLTLEAFAKVNRSLLVLGRRHDGFHELRTLFETIDLSDVLTFEEAPELSLASSAGDLSVGEDNLVLRAARVLLAASGAERGARIHLEKRIPWGAGLGGGSADAAATLLGLRALWGLDTPDGVLHDLAAGLGSDVPFFLVGGRAVGEGRGERLTALPDPAGPEWIVLLSPPFGLPTPAVFARLGLTPGQATTNLPGSDSEPFPDRNDLEQAAESLRGELRILRSAISSAGATSARLSGSGSSVFGVFASRESALQGAANLGEVPEGTRIRVVPTIARRDFQARAFPGDEERR